MRGAARAGTLELERGRPLRTAASGMKTSRSSSSLTFESRLSKLKRASSDDLLSKSRGIPAPASRLKKTVTTGAISELAESRLKAGAGTLSVPKRSGIPGPREASATTARERVALHGQANAKRVSVSTAPARRLRSPAKPQPGHGAGPETQGGKPRPEARAKNTEAGRVSRELQGSSDAERKMAAGTAGPVQREPALGQEHLPPGEASRGTSESENSSSTDSSLPTPGSGSALHTSGSSSSDLTKESLSPGVSDLKRPMDGGPGPVGGLSMAERLQDGTAEDLQAPPKLLTSKQQVLHEVVVERVQRDCMQRLSPRSQEGAGERGQTVELQEGRSIRSCPVAPEQGHAELRGKAPSDPEQLADMQQQLNHGFRGAAEAQGAIRGPQEEVAELRGLLEVERDRSRALAKMLEDLRMNSDCPQGQLETAAGERAPGPQPELTCTGLRQELSEAHGELTRLEGLLSKTERERQQLSELCDKQGEQLTSTSRQLQEKASENQAELRDLKDTIYELEDQVEQDRAVKLHNYQVISDLEGKVMKLEEQKVDLERQLKAVTKQMKKDVAEWRTFQADLQTAVVVANDIKCEAQQELRLVKRRLQEEEERSRRLQQELEAVQASRCQISRGPSEDGGGVCPSPASRTEPGEPPPNIKSLIRSFDMGSRAGGAGQNVPVHTDSRSPLSGIPVRTAPAAAVSPMQRHSLCGSGKPASRGSGMQTHLRETPHTDMLKRRAEELKPDYFLSKSPSLESLGNPLSLSFGTKMSALASSSFRSQSKLSVERKDPLAALAREYGGSKRNGLLKWCQKKTEGYPDIDITNFSGSWSDGLALCALLHTYLPAHIPYQELSSQSKKRNFLLAFQAAESVGIQPCLELSEMMHAERPDWQRVMQYVAQIYSYFET
ncbi:cytospin-B [Rhinatrema bivittatum]|uniref:cytospin-B n=1 Tax=Rhinatrema bivittatum TaxID=194408 RepID=UPI00112E4256|nr:cytospin-B [Rhinatrema bivittatum]